MNTSRFVFLLLLLATPIFAKDVTYRLLGAEPLTFTIPDDWSSAWSPVKFCEAEPDAPADLILFTPKPHSERAVALQVDARKTLCPLTQLQSQLRRLDRAAQAIIPPGELHNPTDGSIFGYYCTDASQRNPGEQRLDAFWNLGSRAWSASSTFPADQTNWVAECVAILESVRLADPNTAPATPTRPVIDGVEDPDFPEALMEEWRKQHE